MTEEQILDLVIIGGGPGGLTAGIYAMRAALKTVLLEKGVPGGQINMSDVVENWPGNELISGPELSTNFSKHAESLGLEIVSREVTRIVPGRDHHVVHLDTGDTLHTHAIILGAGGSPRKLDIPGENEYFGRGVSYCAVCDGFFFRGKTVAVIGGGDSACEESLYLAKITKKVYLVHRRDAFRASMLLQERVKADCNIEILFDTVPVEICAGADGVDAVDLKNVKTGERRHLATDGVFIFIGFLPNNGLVPAGVKLNADGYVITDGKCETGIPGIFAIGDLREKYARQILTAAADGCTAALAAAHYVETRRPEEEVCELPEALQ